MSARFRWHGLDDFEWMLLNLPADLTAEASHLVEAAANGAEAQIRAGYPRGLRGHLLAGLSQIRRGGGQFVVSIQLRNRAALAWIFEHGTEVRRYVTIHGRTHVTGRMPAGHVFIPAVVRKRRQMYEALKDLLVRKGFAVSGDATR